MMRESWLVRAKRLRAEHEAKETVEEALHKRLRWEDWATLLPELVGFARSEIRRRRWRGGRSRVLPEGYDANSVAAEVIRQVLEGKARLAVGWTRERLVTELQRKVSNEVRRLHKLQEASKIRSEWEVLPPRANGELRSVFDGLKGRICAWPDARQRQARQKARQEAEERIAGALGEGDEARVFGCLREGVVKRREIAAKLGMSVVEVTNCRKRLNRKLDELVGIPQWVIEEWKRK
jgi:hypothetical protein